MTSIKDKIPSKPRIKLSTLFLFAFVLLSYEACNNGSGGGLSPTPTVAASIPCNSAGVLRLGSPSQVSATGANTMPVYFCNGADDANEPCVTVTVCTPSTSNCDVIPNVLLDTGSFGLRVFSTTIVNSSPTQETNINGKNIAECALFGTGAAWGPVQKADVYLGGEPVTTIPIQIMNANYSGIPSICSSNGPKTPGGGSAVNGIMGVGPFSYDGTGSFATYYYDCSGSNCSTSSPAVPPAKQVVNPVYSLSQDNNGLILALPGVNIPGANSLSGTMIMGIGTQANNTAGSVTAYPMNGQMQLTTTYNGMDLYESFIDSGSNTLSFPAVNGLNTCADIPELYCPNTPACYTTNIVGYTGSPSGVSNFRVDNADSISSQGDFLIYPTLASALPGSLSTYPIYDWGLPFFLGRAVYVGFVGRTATGIPITGPYWAY